MLETTLTDGPPMQVGRYRLIAQLAHGGMGYVYLGVAQGAAGFSKTMVVKMLRRELADDERFLAMFLEEARLAARLSHPNVVQTVEVGTEGRRPFLVMEYLEGQTLQRMRARLGKDQRFPLGAHLRVIVEALNGLHYAHELADIDGQPLHVVHRDATPHNVFVTYDGQVKVVDFGIAKAMDSSLETRTGELKGKVAYMSPEQANGLRVDRRADVFSIGVMLWEAAVGQRMWAGMNELAIMSGLFTGAIPSARERDPSVPPELDAICRRALAPKPDDRHATAAELAADVERFLASIGDRTTMRDVAQMLCEAFEEDRREQREAIERQLRALRSGSADVDVPSLPASSGAVNVAPLQALPGAVPWPPAPIHKSRVRPLAVGVLVAGVLGVVAIVVLFAWRAALGVAGWLVDDDPAPVASAPQGRSRADSVDLTITASPHDAMLFFDDAPLGPGPYHGSFPRDGLTHRVRAEATLHAPRTEIIVFDKPAASVNLSLANAPPVKSDKK